jgi:hypothetical protein
MDKFEKEYIEAHTENGLILYEEIQKIDDKIFQLEKLKTKLRNEYAEKHSMFIEGERVEITFPNKQVMILDIIDEPYANVLFDRNEYDICYNYRKPNKNNTKAKTGFKSKFFQSQIKDYKIIY